MKRWLESLARRNVAELPEPLALDLQRLKTARRSLGQASWPLAFKYPEPREQLRRISQDLGNRLSTCSPQDRAAVVDAFSAADHLLPAAVSTPSRAARTPQADSALETGCADLGRTLTDRQLAEIHAWLRTRPVLLAHDAHVAKAQAPSTDEVPAEQNYCCYDYLDLWSAPHIIELASQDRFLDLAQSYLGCTPTLYSINAFWSFPNRQPNKASQVFHRDWEDFRSLVVFTLLTPVEVPEEGAHYYVETSHEVERFETALRGRNVSADDVENLLKREEKGIAETAIRLFENSARRFDGAAGRSFCSDGYGLHRAVVPKSRPRLLLWCRFGNFFNETAYRITLRNRDPEAARRVLARIPATPRHRYVFRYLIEALSALK